MRKWLNTLCKEKGIEVENEFFQIENEGDLHIISLDILINNVIPYSSQSEQEEIKKILVKIDFYNGDIMDFFKQLAEGYIYTNF